MFDAVPKTSAARTTTAEPRLSKAIRDPARLEIGRILRSRRGKIRPSDVGLKAGPNRHVAGLRREEVASIAGISPSLLAWYEQGYPIPIKAETLERVTEALWLDPIQTAHVFHLAGLEYPQRPARCQEMVSPAYQRVLDSHKASPALIMGRRWDILGWNDPAFAVFSDLRTMRNEDRNIVWWMFSPDSTLPRIIEDWEGHARRIVAQFRLSWGRHLGDPEFAELIDRLKLGSEHFREWWTLPDTRGRAEGRKEIIHPDPDINVLVFEQTSYQILDAINPEQDLKMVLYTPFPEEDTEKKVAELLRRMHAQKGA